MTDDGRKSFFTTLPGILSGTAALMVAITSIGFGLYDRRIGKTPSRPDPIAPAVRPSTVSPLDTGPAAESRPPVSLEARRQQVERLAGEYLDALLQRDVDQLVQLSETPFYLGEEIVVTRGSLAGSYRELFKEMDREAGFRIQKIRARTLAEIKAIGALPERDSVFNSLSLADTDWGIEVQVRIPEHENTEKMFVFARTIGDRLKIVGMAG